MKIRKPFFRLVICLAVVSLISAVALADTIKLRDGSVLKGKVVSYNQRKFTIVVYIGGASSQYVIPVEEIDSVEFDSSDVATTPRAESGAGNAAPVAAPPPIDSQRNNTPETSAPRDEARTSPGLEPLPADASGGSVPVIAEKTVSVAGAADWTSTEIRVQRGQRIVISASGEVDLGDNKRSGPEGLSAPDARKLIAAKPTGALIAVVGDDNDDFIYVGSATEFVSTHNGILFLSVNEGNLKDNGGAFLARVKVLSGR